MRTSRSHPLKIAECPLPTGGVIGLSFCPGKKQLTSLTGGWDRDLDTDLEVIRSWGADLVLTLVMHDELHELHVPDLGARVEWSGMQWMHRPIVDGGVPDSTFMRRWHDDQARIGGLLASGKRVFVHCKGGLGRAGTVSAMLLMSFGCDGHSAIKRVRAARGQGAIENALQENFLLTLEQGGR